MAKNIFITTLARIFAVFLRTLRLGSGSTWPGEIALFLNRNFIKDIVNLNKNLKVILVAGTNGKTTTVKLLKQILEGNKQKVFHNQSGANLLNGIASALLDKINVLGKLKENIAIFEVDENILPLALSEISPYQIIILNLFRDQLDRYGEVNTTAKKWENALAKIPKNTIVVLNGDDPQLFFIGLNLSQNVYFFGIDKKDMEKKSIPHDVDFIYCPICSNKLSFDFISYSHLGKFFCKACGFKQKNIESFQRENILYPVLGKYNIYNTHAAILAARVGFHIGLKLANNYLSGFSPAFGRGEIIKFQNKKIVILLSKNPASFNQSIELVKNAKGAKNALVILNDRVPDGHDVSWIWDVDFENLTNTTSDLFISGDRAYDLAIRIKYALDQENFNNKKLKIIENIKTAINKAVEHASKNTTIYILPTYSAMLEARKIITGKQIL